MGSHVLSMSDVDAPRMAMFPAHFKTPLKSHSDHMGGRKRTELNVYRASQLICRQSETYVDSGRHRANTDWGADGH